MEVYVAVRGKLSATICHQASLYLFTVLPQSYKCLLSDGGFVRWGENLGLMVRRSEESLSAPAHTG